MSGGPATLSSQVLLFIDSSITESMWSQLPVHPNGNECLKNANAFMQIFSFCKSNSMACYVFLGV